MCRHADLARRCGITGTLVPNSSNARQVLSGTSWSFTLRMPQRGTYTFSVEAHDRSGNIASAGTFTLTSDGTLPESKIYLPVVRNGAP